MKKIISILIALTMLVSMIPTVFAEGETETTTEVSYIEEYCFTHAGTSSAYFAMGSKPDNKDVVERQIGDKTYYLDANYHTSYGDRKWRWLDVNDETIMKAVDYEGRIFRLFKDSTQDFLQLNLGWDSLASGAYNGTHPTLGLALVFEAPEKTGFYIPKVRNAPSSAYTPEKFYVGKLFDENNELEDYTTLANEVSYSKSSTVFTLKKAIYTSSVDEIVIAMTGPSKEYRFEDVTLTEILNPVLAFSKASYTFNIDDGNTANDTASAAVTVTGKTLLSGETVATDVSMPMSNDFITYKSLDEKVAKVSADGTITAVGKGNTKIYAETKDGAYKTPEVTVTVTGSFVGKQYILNREELGSTTNIYLSEVKDFGEHGWKYFDIADIIEENKQTNVAQVKQAADSIIFYLKNKSVESPLAYALSLEAPAKAGFYLPEFNTYVNYSAGNTIDWYMSTLVEERESVEDYIVASEKILTTDKLKYSAPIQVSDFAIYAEPGDEIISTMSAINSDYKFTNIYLAEILAPELAIFLKNTSFDISDSDALNDIATVSAMVSGTTQEKNINRVITDMPVSNSFITYKSSNDAVAKVDASGTITAIGAGEAKIWAESKDGLVKSNEVTITVTAPAAPEDDEELSNAFEVTEAPAIGYVESTVTGITEDETIEAEKNSNGTFTLTAPETKDDAKFLYWAKGMSANKKIVSFSNKLENYMPEENGKNYLIAVYEGDVSETAEYYNANGQRIATGTEPALPSMAGYGKATGWKKYGATNIYVAEYAGKTQPDNVTVTVDGNERTVPYGTKITCTADSTKENFKCWTKSDINGKTEIVSASEVYSFNAWENCTVTAVYEEHTYTGSKLKIILDTFTAGNVTAVMAEFIGLSDAVEKGIMYNGTKIAMTTPGNQFTVTAEDGGTFTGYAVVKNATDGYTLITDGSVTVSK